MINDMPYIPDEFASIFGLKPRKELTDQQKAGKALLEVARKYGSPPTQ